ncbi:MAG TPA: hypothetical protein VFF63_08485 [Candidatus Babeliales bacterium]|nr:hypothetical protein [Candidatus Babeliales bacterium]
MRRFGYAIVATAFLPGCASPWSLGPAPNAVAQTASSWISPAAQAGDLLYVTDVGTNLVDVYTYPQGAPVGSLSGFHSPVRDCSDTAGNVYITNTIAQTILEYAHGGTSPIAIFSDTGFLPQDCAVDPVTGTLAVTNYGPKGSNTGSVAIYKSGAHSPKIYQARGVQAYLFCAYDDAGDLFVDGLNHSYDFVLIELPKGATAFERIKLHQSFTGWGGVQWTGSYVAIGDGSTTVYEFAIDGTKAIEEKAVTLHHAINVVQFCLDSSTFVAPDGPNGGNHDVGVWSGGGRLKKTIGKGVFKNPSGATISIAP